MNNTLLNEINNQYNKINNFIYKENKYIGDNKIVFNLLFYWIRENLNRFSEINGGLSGVYFIEDFYIGKTGDIYNRVSSHILDIFKGNGNTEKVERTKDLLSNNKKIKVNIISKKQSDEESLIIKYSNDYDLTNIEFNPKKKCKKFDKREIKKATDLDLDMPDYATIDFYLDYHKKLNSNLFDYKSDYRYLVILTNIKNKKKGAYLTKCKLSYLTQFLNPKSLSGKLLVDYQKYGPSNFTIEFIRIDNIVCKNNQLSYFNNEKIKVYNTLPKNMLEPINFSNVKGKKIIRK